jgi:hypothetical protein
VLRPEDWQRFDLYAPYVRKMNISHHEIAFSDSRLFEKSLARRLRGDTHEYLLPNITHMEWCSIEDENDVAPFCSLLAPGLTTLNFWLSLNSPYIPEVTEVIDAIENHCPLIRELKIFTIWEADETRVFADSIPPFFFSHRSLRILKLETRVFTSLLATVPVLPELYQLELFGDYDAADAAHLQCAISRSSALLPVLSDLRSSFTTEPIHFFAKFLPVAGHLLQSLHISGGSHDHRPDLPRLIEVVAESCLVLKALKIAVHANPAPHNPSPKLLHPLVKLNLICLEIASTSDNVDTSCSLSERDISLMASVWSNLEVLRLAKGWRQASVPPRHHTESTLSIDAIFILCAKCPRLRSLALIVDTSIPPSGRGHLDVRPSSLKNLEFGGSSISDPWNVAFWLGDICPFHGIQWACIAGVEETDATDKSWEEMKKILQKFQAIPFSERQTESDIKKRRVEMKASVALAG